MQTRVSRKASTLFPTLPPALITKRFRDLKTKYRRLGDRKCKHKKLDKDVSGIEDERTAVLLDARALANKQIAHAWEQLERFEWPRFPRKAKSNPMYEQLTSLRESYRKLKDLARKYPQRSHYKEQAAVVLEKAWCTVSAF